MAKRKTIPTGERFWRHVEKTETCWLWQGSRGAKGHGRFYFEGRVQVASRVAWQLSNGPIPDGLYVLHNCPGGDNPACVRVDHLYLGTILDNSRDMIERGNVCTGARHWEKRMPELIQRGEARHSHVLTEADVHIIRAEHVTGASNIALGRRFHVAPRTIRDAVNRRTWTHI